MMDFVTDALIRVLGVIVIHVLSIKILFLKIASHVQMKSSLYYRMLEACRYMCVNTPKLKIA